MRKRFVFAFAAGMLLYSCSSLSNSQKTIIQQMASSGKAYADAPKPVLTVCSQCLYKSAQLQAANAQDTTTMMNKLDLSAKAYFDRVSYSEGLSLSYQLLSQYFAALIDFIGVDTTSDIKTSLATFGTNIDSLASKINTVRPHAHLPIGFGTITGNLVKYAGKKYISHKELVYAREFANKGQALVDTLCGIMKEIIMETLVKKELVAGDAQLRGEYNIYVAQLEAAGKTGSALYKDVNPIYLGLKTCFGQALLLCEKLDEATGRLPPAHREMVEIMSMKKTKNVTPKDIAIFADLISQLADLINQFKSSN
jgi:hypothetical protein